MKFDYQSSKILNAEILKQWDFRKKFSLILLNLEEIVTQGSLVSVCGAPKYVGIGRANYRRQPDRLQFESCLSKASSVLESF